jgi:hypothetical protein
MPSLFLLSRAQMRCIKPLFPKPRGLPRVNDRRVISGIVPRDPQWPTVERRAPCLWSAQDVV